MDEPSRGPAAGPAGDDPGPDRRATRLATTWIWTVLFAANGLVTYSYLSLAGVTTTALLPGLLQPPGRGRFGAPVEDPSVMALPALVALGVLCTFGAWAYLFLFFSYAVIPVAVLGQEPAHDDRWRLGIARALTRTYLLVVVGALVRLAPELFLIFRPLLSRF